jgi:hypothetical protein
MKTLRFEENISYMGWPHCLRLSNAEVELIVATDIGIRILHFGFIGEKNIFYLSPEDLGKTGGDQWRIYGGHRLWHAPEEMPRTYAPDNGPIMYSFESDTLKLIQPVEKDTGIVKALDIYLAADSNQVRLVHRLINQNTLPVQLSAWALSALIPEGTAIIPQESYGEGNDFLLPARSMALWNYTQMNDPRWIWGNKFILATPDLSSQSEQKIGLLNKPGWTAYSMKDELLVKIFEYDPASTYPDFMSNQEIYFNQQFLEIETLGPYAMMHPGGQTENTEHWALSKDTMSCSDRSIEENVLPRVTALRNFRYTYDVK